MKKLEFNELLDALRNSKLLTSASGRAVKGASGIFLLPYFKEINKLHQSGINFPLIFRLFKDQGIVPKHMTLAAFRTWCYTANKKADQTAAMAAEICSSAEPKQKLLLNSNKEQKKVLTNDQNIPVYTAGAAELVSEPRTEDFSEPEHNIYDWKTLKTDQLWQLYSEKKVWLEDIPDKYRMKMIYEHWDFESDIQKTISYSIWKQYYEGVLYDLRYQRDEIAALDPKEYETDIPDEVFNRSWQPAPDWVKTLSPLQPHYPFLSPVTWLLYDSNGFVLEPRHFYPIPDTMTLYSRALEPCSDAKYGSIWPDDYRSPKFGEDFKSVLSGFFESHGGRFMNVVKILPD